jgi:hypothetical protein
VSPVKYELCFYIPEDEILHNRRGNHKSFVKILITEQKARNCFSVGTWTLVSLVLRVYVQVICSRDQRDQFGRVRRPNDCTVQCSLAEGTRVCSSQRGHD